MATVSASGTSQTSGASACDTTRLVRNISAALGSALDDWDGALSAANYRRCVLAVLRAPGSKKGDIKEVLGGAVAIKNCSIVASPSAVNILAIDGRLVLSRDQSTLDGIAEIIVRGDALESLFYSATKPSLRPVTAMMPHSTASKLVGILSRLLRSANAAVGGLVQQQRRRAHLEVVSPSAISGFLRRFALSTYAQYSQSEAYCRANPLQHGPSLSIYYECCRHGALQEGRALKPGQRQVLQGVGCGAEVVVHVSLCPNSSDVSVEIKGEHTRHDPSLREPLLAEMHSAQELAAGLRDVDNADYIHFNLHPAVQATIDWLTAALARSGSGTDNVLPLAMDFVEQYRRSHMSEHAGNESGNGVRPPLGGRSSHATASSPVRVNPIVREKRESLFSSSYSTASPSSSSSSSPSSAAASSSSSSSLHPAVSLLPAMLPAMPPQLLHSSAPAPAGTLTSSTGSAESSSVAYGSFYCKQCKLDHSCDLRTASKRHRRVGLQQAREYLVARGVLLDSTISPFRWQLCSRDISTAYQRFLDFYTCVEGVTAPWPRYERGYVASAAVNGWGGAVDFKTVSAVNTRERAGRSTSNIFSDDPVAAAAALGVVRGALANADQADATLRRDWDNLAKRAAEASRARAQAGTSSFAASRAISAVSVGAGAGVGTGAVGPDHTDSDNDIDTAAVVAMEDGGIDNDVDGGGGGGVDDDDANVLGRSKKRRGEGGEGIDGYEAVVDDDDRLGDDEEDGEENVVSEAASYTFLSSAATLGALARKRSRAHR